MSNQQLGVWRGWALGLALVVVGAGGPTAAQTGAPAAAAARPVPAEQFFRDPDLTEAVLSPSGQRLAVTSARGGGRIGLYVIDLANGSRSNSAAQYADADIQDVQWVNDDRLVFSVTDYSGGSGRPDGAPGLFAVNHDGSRLRGLVKRKLLFVTDGLAKDPALEWNHWLLAVPVPRAGEANEEVLIGELTLRDDFHVSHIRPLWLNVRSGATRSTDFTVPQGMVSGLFDSRGDPRVVVTLKGNRRSAYWRAPGRSDWQLIVEGDLIGLPFTPHSVDDAGNLYVLRADSQGDKSELARYDFARKRPSPEALVSVPGFDFQGRLIIDRVSGAAQGVRLLADAETTVWFDEGMKQLQALVDRRLPGRVNRISCSRCGQPDTVTLVRSFSDQDPGQIWLHRGTPAEGKPAWEAVGRTMPGIDPRQMAAVDLQRIQARDGRDLPVWLTLPAGVQPGKPAPAVVLVHGGPWTRGGDWSWDPMAQFLASRGYLVIEPEFRGSTGYGEAHFRAGWKQWGQAMQDDVADALLWAQKQGLATQQACIAGASYGGYSTLMGLVRHADLYRCGVAWAAVTDLKLFVEGSWWVSDDVSGLSRRHTLPQMVGDAIQDAAMITSHSPVRQAARIKAPVLLAFGEADLRVPLAHGERMREALVKAGNEPEWITYPGEGHGWARLENKVDFARRVERFLATHLRPVQR